MLGLLLVTPTAKAATFTWDGGGADGNWSTAANWNPDGAPGATGNTLTFGGTAHLSAVNDIVTSLANGGITFDATAGSFNLGGNAIAIGTSGGGGFTVINQQSANNQEISLNLNLASGGGDRSVVMSGAGSLTLSGNLSYSNSWLFPTSTAGTIIISGNNSGDVKGGIVSAGGNSMRATIGNNVAGTQLVFGSDTAIGNAGSGDVGLGTAGLRGIQARQQTNISTIGNRDLSAYAIVINASNVTFNGTSNMIIGHVINQGGNRDFVVSSSGQVTVAHGISLSHDQTSRTFYVNLSGAGGMVVDGKIYDSFHSSGLTTAGTSLLRKGGTGTLTLNGDSSSTLASKIQIEAGTLKIGHAGALGATGTGGATELKGGNLDLNGQTIGETLNITSSSSRLINSSASAATITADSNTNTSFTVDAAGDITVTRLIGSSIFTLTKEGAGTLTTNGSSHNNLMALNLTAGTVIFANTSGYGADRGVTINGGTLKLSGSNSNLINDAQAFTMTGGVFDLNGKNEAVAAIDGSAAATIHNGAAATTSILYVGGGPSGTSSATFAGVIEDGTGTLALTKEGGGTQTLSGSNTYSGATTVSSGTLLANNTSGSATGTGAVTVNSGATLGGTGTLSPGTGSSVILNGSLAPGDPASNSGAGTLTFTPVDGNVTFGSTATADFQLLTNGTHGYSVTYHPDGTLATLSGTYTSGGNDRLVFTGGASNNQLDFTSLASGTFNITFAAGYTPTANDLFDLLDWTNLTGTGNLNNESSAIAGLTLAQLNLQALSGGLAWDTSRWTSDGVLAIYTVPEPGRAAFLLLGGILALLRRRKPTCIC
ncbi:MAG: autotransporter-associated beta strand repeat-containing protein [Prosthecobacter sp.]|nr:autotransporter-associated beta strand repeat-containing protein [Prosthecobacter sp.]